MADERIESQCGFSIIANKDEGEAFEAFTDHKQAIKMLVAVLADDMAQRNVTADDFKRSLTGETLDAAYVALSEAVEDFFRSLRKVHLAETLRATREAIFAASAQSAVKVQSVTTEQLIAPSMKRLDNALAAALNDSGKSSDTSGD